MQGHYCLAHQVICAAGLEEAGAAFTASLASMVYGSDASLDNADRPRLGLCAYLNASVCHPTVEMSNLGDPMTVVAYNPLAWARVEGVRVPVNTSYTSNWTVTGAGLWRQHVLGAVLHVHSCAHSYKRAVGVHGSS